VKTRLPDPLELWPRCEKPGFQEPHEAHLRLNGECPWCVVGYLGNGPRSELDRKRLLRLEVGLQRHAAELAAKLELELSGGGGRATYAAIWREALTRTEALALAPQSPPATRD
jgi:hypothetical protein